MSMNKDIFNRSNKLKIITDISRINSQITDLAEAGQNDPIKAINIYHNNALEIIPNIIKTYYVFAEVLTGLNKDISDPDYPVNMSVNILTGLRNRPPLNEEDPIYRSWREAVINYLEIAIQLLRPDEITPKISEYHKKYIQ